MGLGKAFVLIVKQDGEFVGSFDGHGNVVIAVFIEITNTNRTRQVADVVCHFR